jgi:hypothetical protein
MPATLKGKQTSIATVQYHLLPVASFLTPLIFHYPLPLKKCSKITDVIRLRPLSPPPFLISPRTYVKNDGLHTVDKNARSPQWEVSLGGNSAKLTIPWTLHWSKLPKMIKMVTHLLINLEGNGWKYVNVMTYRIWGSRFSYMTLRPIPSKVPCLLLKVHKREKFFCSDFEFFTIL